MRVVVTGGAGFVGSHLCDALIAGGDHVFALTTCRLADSTTSRT
jgi:nucleoside-diphosphate-sugar epimerase